MVHVAYTIYKCAEYFVSEGRADLNIKKYFMVILFNTYDKLIWPNYVHFI